MVQYNVGQLMESQEQNSIWYTGNPDVWVTDTPVASHNSIKWKLLKSYSQSFLSNEQLGRFEKQYKHCFTYP